MEFNDVKIIVNENTDPNFEYANAVMRLFQNAGIKAELTTPNEPCGNARFYVVLGGDGTMLRVSHDAAVRDIPMIGINLGNLGFLTDVDKSNGLDALQKVIAGKHSQEKRIMLEAEFGADKIIPLQERLALNEVFVGVSGRLTNYTIYINEQRMSSTRSDGIIISTPTGSTAYNLSAGGPILMPGSQMFAITTVCPHSLVARPWVIDADSTVRIVAKQTSQINVDGCIRGEIPQGESVLIKKSEHRATIIKTAHVNFYNTLRMKKLM